MKALSTDASHIVYQRCALTPRVGLVLGTGLGHLVDILVDPVSFPYRELPGFPDPKVSSHAGVLTVGELCGTTVAVLQGRVHYYEQGQLDGMRTPIQTLAALGCQILLLTNSAGSLREDVSPGALVAITDHINLSSRSPLIGEVGDQCFVDMSNAYDSKLLDQLERTASRLKINIDKGIYWWSSGPNFETPAEIRAARILGADVVGMSTVPETILARRFGLRVMAISTITNLAAGLADEPLSHQQSKLIAGSAADRLSALIAAWLTELRDA